MTDEKFAKMFWKWFTGLSVHHKIGISGRYPEIFYGYYTVWFGYRGPTFECGNLIDRVTVALRADKNLKRKLAKVMFEYV